MLTHLRRRLKFTMLGEAKRQPPKSKAAFKRSALGLFKGLTSPELIAELDRIGEQREGISKLIDEAWIDLEVDRREEEAIVQYWARFREPKSALAERIACAAAKDGS